MNKNTTYWYDSLFDADLIHEEELHPIPSRETTSIAGVESMWINEEKRRNEPKTFVDAYRSTHLTEPAF